MTLHFVHHRIDTRPRRWKAVADRLADRGAAAIATQGGRLYGLWRSQIGLPRDTVTAITHWPDAQSAAAHGPSFGAGLDDIAGAVHEPMTATLRPTAADAPRRQGNYAFRWFDTPEADFAEFLDLCGRAWPGFEAAYDSQVIGLWRLDSPGDNGAIRSVMLTRRPDLSMWERSKIPANAAEAEVRATLSRRYDLCDWTVVHTATLLTAADTEDTVRWA